MPGLHGAKPKPLGVREGKEDGGANHAAAGHHLDDIAEPMVLGQLLPVAMSGLHGDEP